MLEWGLIHKTREERGTVKLLLSSYQVQILMPILTTVFMVYDYDTITPQAYCSIVTEKSIHRVLWVPVSQKLH